MIHDSLIYSMLCSPNSWLTKNAQVSGQESCQTWMSGKRILSATLRVVWATMRGKGVKYRHRGPPSRAILVPQGNGEARVRDAATGEAHTLGARSVRKEATEQAGKPSSAGTVWVKVRRTMDLANLNKLTFVRKISRPIFSTWKPWKIRGRWPRTSRLQIKISISLSRWGCTNPWRMTSSIGAKY